MTRVCFGDKPSGAIATIALRSTAKENEEQFPRAVEMILKNTYVDDTIYSFDDTHTTIETATAVNDILKTGGFEMKESVTNVPKKEMPSTSTEMMACLTCHETSNIPGMKWNPTTDKFQFTVHLNFSPKRRKVKLGPDLTRDQLKDMPLTARTHWKTFSIITNQWHLRPPSWPSSSIYNAC